MAFRYPKARRNEYIKEKHFGIEISDPYRWLEDRNSMDAKRFIYEQNRISKPYINSYKHRRKFREKLIEMWTVPNIDPPIRKGNFYFQTRNSGLQNQSILYKLKTLRSPPQIFLDPNKFSADGRSYLTMTEFSPKGSVLAYGIGRVGVHFFEVRFKKIDGTYYNDVLKRIEYSDGSWTHDEVGYIYTYEKYKLCYHRLGTRQSDDIDLVCDKDFTCKLTGNVSDCGRYLIVSIAKHRHGNAVSVLKLSDVFERNKPNLISLVKAHDRSFSYVTNNGQKFYFLTNKDASRYKIVSIDLNDFSENSYRDLIAEHPSDILHKCQPVNENKLVLVYLKDVAHKMQIHSLDTGEKLMDISLELGTITRINCSRSDVKLFFGFISFKTPQITYMVDFKKDKQKPTVVFRTYAGRFKPQDFENTQVFFKSKDNISIPMFIFHKKGIKFDGSNPCHLYGYGGFNLSYLQYFSVMRLIWATYFNGVFAIANIRGGGEYGTNWHKAGILEKKQNSFDDFQYAAKYLINNKYTKPKLLAIQGGSNGGLLVAACVNQAPELFGAAIINEGVLDMLRFHKTQVGKSWICDFGNPDEAEAFKYIYAYSPLHNIREPEKGQFPAVLVKTTEGDDRVVPFHSLKYIAELQKKMGSLSYQKRPLLLLVDSGNNGHGWNKSPMSIIEETVDTYCFIAKALGITYDEKCFCGSSNSF